MRTTSHIFNDHCKEEWLHDNRVMYTDVTTTIIHESTKFTKNTIHFVGRNEPQTLDRSPTITLHCDYLKAFKT